MFGYWSPLPAIGATAFGATAIGTTACKLVLLLALLWQASGASAMALMGCCLEPQPCCVAAIAASHCAVCAPVAVVEATAFQPAAVPAAAAIAIDLQTKRWVEPVDDVWRPPIVRCLGACRAWGVASEKRPQRGQFLPDLQAHSSTMGQKAGKKWTAEAVSQPTIPKSDRLLAQAFDVSINL